MKNALVIVAHPDDETIWMGGTILKNKNWKWTILSLCRKNDADREPKFMEVCSFYGAEGIISDLDDEKLTPLQVNEVIKKIKQNLKKSLLKQKRKILKSTNNKLFLWCQYQAYKLEKMEYQII